MIPTLPNVTAPALDSGGRFQSSWITFFTQLIGRGTPAKAQAVSGSPASFSAEGNGSFLVVGGSVSTISLIRGRVSLPTGLSGGFIPVSQGDVLVITYSGAPAVTFVPS